MSKLLLLGSLLCAVIASIIGFGGWVTQADNVLGWLSASVALFVAADLLGLVDL